MKILIYNIEESKIKLIEDGAEDTNDYVTIVFNADDIKLETFFENLEAIINDDARDFFGESLTTKQYKKMQNCCKAICKKLNI